MQRKNTMKHSISTIILLLLVSGCSFYTTNSFYEVGNTSNLLKTEVYDWSETGAIAGISIGHWAPPTYAYKSDVDYYIIYPIKIEEVVTTFGPPIFPIIPLSTFFKSTNDLNKCLIRYYNENSAGENPPKSMVISHNEEVINTCLLKEVEKDQVGRVFSCHLSPLQNNPKSFSMKLILFDGKEIEVEMTRGNHTEYSLLTSINGPNPKPSIRFKQ